VIDFLKAHPDFFSTHAQVLADINVPHPQSGQAISLVERQAMVLRERIKVMELKLAELLRHGQENDAIAKSIQHWVRGLLLHHDRAGLPDHLANSLAKGFSVPQVGIAIWRPADELASAPWAVADTADYIAQIDGMSLPVVGPASVCAATQILSEPEEAKSVAVLPLRTGAAPQAFGVLVLGSPDPHRFAAHLGVAFLEQISEMASAALSVCVKT
jgi:uncharacterized protein